jgi:hypothetical protein
MPQLHNIKHEKFCKSIVVDGLSAPNAYEAAGFIRSRQNAHKLLQRHDVKLRIDELRTEQEEVHAEGRRAAVEKAAITLEALIEQAQEIQRLAIQDKVYGAGVSALREVGVLTGYRVERQLSKAQVQQVGSIEELSDEDLLEQQARMLFGLCGGLGLDPDTTSVTLLIDALFAAHEAQDAREDAPRDRGRPVAHSRGIRAETWRPGEKQLTKGEAEKLARRPVKVINGSVAPNGRR